jgi:hypothetical protein
MQPLIDAESGGLAFVTLYPAALIAIFICGNGPALLSILLSGLAGEFLFRPPVMGFGSSFSAYLSLGFFYINTALIGLGIAVIRDQAARIRQSYTRLRHSESQLCRSLEAMTRLHRLGQLPICPGNLESLFNEIVETAIAITDADFGNMQLLQPESGDLKIACQIGFPTWWVERWDIVTRGQGISGTALERGERVIIEDVELSGGSGSLDRNLRELSGFLQVKLPMEVTANRSTPDLGFYRQARNADGVGCRSGNSVPSLALPG